MQAGFGSDQDSSYMLVLETKAAAMYYQQEILDTPQNNRYKLTSEYLLVELEESAINIGAHRLTKTHDGKFHFEELYKTCRSQYGICAISNMLEKMLQKLFQLTTEDIWEFKTKFPYFWRNMIPPNSQFIDYVDDYFKISAKNCQMPVYLSIYFLKFVENKTGKDIKHLIKDYQSNEIEFDDEDPALVLSKTIAHSLCLPVMSHIIMAISQVLKKPECACVKKIILIGVDAPIFFQHIQEEFLPSIETIINELSFFAVAKGAILYGLNHHMIDYIEDQVEAIYNGKLINVL